MVAHPETERAVDGIRVVNGGAFQGHSPSQQTERLIVEAVRTRGACGRVLVGDPTFSGGIGSRQHLGDSWHGVPDENVLCLSLSGEMPIGEVACHPAIPAGM